MTAYPTLYNKNDFIKFLQKIKIKEFYGSVFLIQMETNDTTYHVNGATQDYITKINNGQYQVSNITQSEKYPDRFDFDYQKK